MNCVETDSLLTVVEALGDQSERKLAHVAQCASCRAAVADLATLRAALAPEAMAPHAIERTANAIRPLAKSRRAEKRTLLGLAIVYGLIVSLTVTAGVAFISSMGQGWPLFLNPLLMLQRMEHTPVAMVLGVIVAWRAYRSERAPMAA